MNETGEKVIAEALVWGQGGPLFELFLEPTCPFSAIAFGKLDDLRSEMGEQGVTVRIWLHSQPWHMFSGIICRAILAASTTEGGKEAAKQVMAAVFADQPGFEFDHHCEGPNLDVTPNALLDRIEDAIGVALRDAFGVYALDREIKRHTKYARQNGIHVSPTFMIDGLVNDGIGSRDPVESWISVLHASAAN